MSTTWLPKQAVQFDGALLQELQGDVSDTIARDLLKAELRAAMKPSSVIHDNGCGYGAVTMAVMDSDPPDGIQIRATDVNPMFLAQLQQTLAKNLSWPVKVDNMDACNLTFDAGTFDLSLTTFVFAGLENDVAAASHILRTLRPGGTGVIAVWKEMPWHVALENAHHKTRGQDEPMAPFLSKSWEAGWKDVKFAEKAVWLNLGADLKRWVTIAWTFLATPDKAIDSVVEELRQLDGQRYKVANGIHKIRMVADVVIVEK
ncbi:S-adenosyl-L-methionine-dependent methyltransferase [Whalleya microplaca]|nr:S-adenosyl-L-methionine-dependent methyltransferase [Whalleya microplaca]